MSDDATPYTTTSPPGITTNGHKPVRRLSALDKLFEATGEVTIRCGSRDVTLPIQAVDLELVESLCRSFKPKPKIVVEMQNGQRIRTVDTTDERYQESLAEFNRTNSYVYVLCALQCDIEDKHGTLVWSADNSVHDIAGARQALKDMGIVDTHLVAILNGATNLTQAVEERQMGE